MNKINNLIYTLEIKYTNNSGEKISITVKFCDNGLETKSIRVGDVCITEETIKGRILSGKFENANEYCGYKYDYKNGENLLNLNPQISIDTAVSLINKKKMETDFLIAMLVLSSVLRGDHRVVVLNNGRLNIIKTISAEDDNLEKYVLKEISDLLKLDGEEKFVVQDKKIICKIGDNSNIEEIGLLADGDIKFNLIKLSLILSKYPQSYKELIELKSQLQKNNIGNSTNDIKTC